MINNIKETFNTKSKEFEHTVSIVTTGAAAGIAVAKQLIRMRRLEL